MAVSNIGWDPSHNDDIYKCMAQNGFSGLEIAPTRVFPDNPYEDLSRASAWAKSVKMDYGLCVCSMQSIWYGQNIRIVDSDKARQHLVEHTKKAIQFADATGCRNIVFGCPRNRAVECEEDIPIVEDFLGQCAEAAAPYGVVIALEPNPTIYHTNFVNTTDQAIELLKRINHPALKLNLDFGTVIENNETIDWILNDGALINHVHISEPSLRKIQKRYEHVVLLELLKSVGYKGFVSIEMTEEDYVQEAIRYMGGLAFA